MEFYSRSVRAEAQETRIPNALNHAPPTSDWRRLMWAETPRSGKVMQVVINGDWCWGEASELLSRD